MLRTVLCGASFGEKVFVGASETGEPVEKRGGGFRREDYGESGDGIAECGRGVGEREEGAGECLFGGGLFKRIGHVQLVGRSQMGGKRRARMGGSTGT